MKYLFLPLLVLLTLMSCKDDDDVVILPFQDQLDLDIAEIETYLADNGITAIKDATGVFYVIDELGTGNDFPTTTSTVSMAYTGRLMYGTVFDSATPTSPLVSSLANLINGWKVGVPKFKKGGKGTLFIPSGYGYGTTGAGGSIGPNTNLIFDIELLNFN